MLTSTQSVPAAITQPTCSRWPPAPSTSAKRSAADARGEEGRACADLAEEVAAEVGVDGAEVSVEGVAGMAGFQSNPAGW